MPQAQQLTDQSLLQDCSEELIESPTYVFKSNLIKNFNQDSNLVIEEESREESYSRYVDPVSNKESVVDLCFKTNF